MTHRVPEDLPDEDRAPRQAARRELKKPALDMQNGTGQLTGTRNQAAAVASPDAITAPWLTSESRAPTRRAIGAHLDNEAAENTVARSRSPARTRPLAQTRPWAASAASSLLKTYSARSPYDAS
ncbi:hypothetical protein GCM10022403_049560 [Streptomyces coacervatus]|uniref:Uncharacterized protein n=1 Tax=Streptomyces coacervatus TaxID=647381 RepID=A0ABP7I1R4_9ACTN|nr:hypothetical protein [Streptomyces coacervatus]MDF2266198.1 hypothetical protein [Streptomyces coacervatus]